MRVVVAVFARIETFSPRTKIVCCYLTMNSRKERQVSSRKPEAIDPRECAKNVPVRGGRKKRGDLRTFCLEIASCLSFFCVTERTDDESRSFGRVD